MVEVSITGKNLFRLIYIILAAIIIAFGIFSMISLSGSPTQFMFRAYNVLFGIFLILAEFKLTFMIKYFNFLRRFIGKGVWCFLIATSWLNTQEWYNWAMAAGFTIVGAIFVWMQFCFQESDEDELYQDSTK